MIRNDLYNFVSYKLDDGYKKQCYGGRDFKRLETEQMDHLTEMQYTVRL